MILHITTWLFTILLICQCREEKNSLIEIDQLRSDFLNFEKEQWNNVLDEHSNTILTNTTMEILLIHSYQLFGDELENRMPYDIDYNLESLQSLWIWARMYSELRGIYALYETFRRFQRLQTDPGRVPSPKQAWVDLAETILEDSKSSVPDALQKINDLVEKDQIFEEVLKHISKENCESHQSPHQILYNLYNSIALIELKGYMMIEFSNMLLTLINQVDNTQDVQLALIKYHESSLKLMYGAKNAMIYAKRDIWRCDPKSHVKGETYTELTELLQAYIENEVDMNDKGNCFQNCAAYDHATSLTCFKNQFCSKQKRCRGKIVNCQYIDSDMKICLSNEKSGRRYDYIQYENGRTLGRRLPCNKGVTHVDSWWRWLFWHCSYCLCLCDDDGPESDRYFSLRPVFSDVKNNRVITGLRIIKKNRIIHLQIQESELLPFGQVDVTNSSWIPVSEFGVNDRYVVKGEDFHTMSWEKRDFDLDNLEGQEGYLLTGVKFKVIGTHLNFEIRTTPFNFTTGKLIQPKIKSEWVSNDNTLNRRFLRMKYKDVPTRSLTASVPDSSHNQYLEFSNSDLDRDAGQTTVPFFDSQMVTSTVPLSGAGLFHKGQPHFGGFITPKLITYDYIRNLNVVFPENKAN